MRILSLLGVAVTACAFIRSRPWIAKEQLGVGKDRAKTLLPSLSTARQIDVGSLGPQNTPPLKDAPPRKIGLFIEPTPFTHVSGYSNRFIELLRYLRKADDNVQIMTTDDKTEAPVEKFDFPVVTTGGFRFPFYDNLVLTFDHEMRGWRLLENFKPDVLHVTSPGFLCVAALLYARLFRVPLVLSYHTHLPVYVKKYVGYIPGIEEITWRVMQFVHNRADLTLVTSPQMREELESHDIERVDVWRKGIDTDVFHPKYKSDVMRSRLTDGHPEDPLIIYVGRLAAEKNLKLLRDVMDEIPNARVAFVGKGPYSDELQKHFEGYNAVFTGLLRGEELSQAFASSDVFCMPSDSETLGFVVLESMASGVPVVGANAGGIPNLINDGKDGFLIESGNAASFAEKIKYLVDNPKARNKMSESARKEAEKWDWESATSYLRNVQYERAIRNFQWRAFDGLGLPRTRTKFRAFRVAIASFFSRARSSLLFMK